MFQKERDAYHKTIRPFCDGIQRTNKSPKKRRKIQDVDFNSLLVDTVMYILSFIDIYDLYKYRVAMTCKLMRDGLEALENSLKKRGIELKKKKEPKRYYEILQQIQKDCHCIMFNKSRGNVECRKCRRKKCPCTMYKCSCCDDSFCFECFCKVKKSMIGKYIEKCGNCGRFLCSNSGCRRKCKTCDKIFCYSSCLMNVGDGVNIKLVVCGSCKTNLKSLLKIL